MAADGGIPLRTGVARLLAEVREARVKLGIASTTTRMNIDALLRVNWGARGVGMFDAICCGDEAAQKKPAPDIYRLVLRALDLGALSCVAFEDTDAGLHAANGAGLYTVVTPTFWSADGDFSGAGLVLDHLGDEGTPIDGEPGRPLRRAAWLSLAELSEIVRARRR